MFKSYLSDRYLYVKIINSVSDICEIKAAIPQGNVLDPIYYAICASDMPFRDDVAVATYAYDTALTTSNNCSTEASNVVQNYLDSISI